MIFNKSRFSDVHKNKLQSLNNDKRYGHKLKKWEEVEARRGGELDFL